MYPKTIYNHDVSRWVAGDGPPNRLYSGRVLGITEPPDVIQLPPELRPQWKAISTHFKRIRLSHSLHPVWDLSWKKLSDFPGQEISVFIFDDVLSSESATAEWFRKRDARWIDCVRYINSKNNFIRLAEKLGVPVPLTICAECKSELNLGSLRFPCFLKPALAGNGAGIVHCMSADDLSGALSLFPEKTPLQVQEEVKATAFINLQYRIEGTSLRRLAATEQILEGAAYCGSRYPSSFMPWKIVDPIAEWMAAKGMKDVFAFDLAVAGLPEDSRYFALECNPRFNGATYPTLVAKKLGIKNWAFESFSTQFETLDQINLEGIEYDSVSGTGVILLNWGTILMGKLGILLAGSEKTQGQLKMQLELRLKKS